MISLQKSLGRLYCVLALLALLGFFGWLAKCNMFFTDSFDTVILRDYDDIGFHLQLQKGRDNLRQGNLIAVLSNNDAAYGNIFWTSLTVLTLPFHDGQGAWAKPLIAFPRQVSLLAYALCFLAFYLICRNRNYTRASSLAGVLLLATCSTGVAQATRFHNYTITAAFVMWSFYFLTLPPTRRRRIISCVLVGIAFGIKITVFYTLPVFFLFLNRGSSWRDVKRQPLAFLKWNSKHLALISIVALLSYSPDVLFLIFGDRHFWDSIESVRFMLMEYKQPPWPPPPTLHEVLRDMFFPAYYHAGLFATALVLMFGLLLYKRRAPLDKVLIPLASLLSLVLVAMMVVSMRRLPHGLYTHTIPLVMLLSLIFVDAANRWKWPALWVSLVIAANLYFNSQRLVEMLTLQPTIAKAEHTRQMLEKFNNYKARIHLQPADRIAAHFNVLFPFGLIKNYKNITFFFDTDSPSLKDHDVFVFAPGSAPWGGRSCEDIQAKLGMSPERCQNIKSIYDAKPPLSVVYEDSDIKVVRQPPRP